MAYIINAGPWLELNAQAFVSIRPIGYVLTRLNNTNFQATIFNPINVILTNSQNDKYYMYQFPLDNLNHVVSTRFNNFTIFVESQKLQKFKTNLLKHIFQTT